MPDQDTAVKRLADYRPCSFATDLELSFNLDPRETRVRTRYNVRRLIDDGKPLALDGVGLKIERVSLNGEPLSPEHYQQEPERLIIETPLAATFKLEIDTVICPEDNTALEGLYMSAGRFCTQCEAEGFRAHHLLRSTVPTCSRALHVRIEADKALSHPALQRQPDRPGRAARAGATIAIWNDPIPSRRYLFALVAGELRRARPTTSPRVAAGSVDAAHPRRSRATRNARAYAMDVAEAGDELGRGRLRARVRPRPVHHRGRARLQFRRDGEQGPQHLQLVAAARRSRHRDRRRLSKRIEARRRPRVLPQLDRQSHHLPRLVPAVPEGRPDRLSRPGLLGRQRRARSSGSRTCRRCARASSRRTPARSPTRCARRATPRSTTSTPRPSTRRARK